jgi:ubiquinone/menaquinone biosynthesis C-methylase UbiE
MENNERKNKDEYYVLETGRAGEKRLKLLHEVYGAGTERLLAEIGLKPGMKVVDFGCGPGIVTRFIARHIGPQGMVLGADLMPEQLIVARQEALTQGLGNIRFVEVDVYSPGLKHESFDMVYCRSVLSHLQHPEKALEEMSALVKPGGALVCEDVDMASIYSDPSTKEYKKMVLLLQALGKNRKADYRAGYHLPEMYKDMGYPEPHVNSYQPRYSTGEPKRYWEYTIYELAPVLIKAGIITQQEMNELAIGLECIGTDDRTIVAHAVQTQVWARK